MSNRVQGRLRFVESRIEKQPDGRLRAEVVLGDGGGRTFTGAAQLASAKDGDLWCVAEATLAALLAALEVGPAALRIRDIVAFEIDGHPAVAVSLWTDVRGEARKLYGLCQADEDRGRAAALAVLSGTNRFFGTD
jgi:hypothetical protein